ncbi:phosphatase [Streptomyces sp. NPDC006990]|uniref:phosphatase n=1 Tax=Streptomyces sp. NPDC006990 TaxID=3154481 RepID=UPI00345330BB
MPSPGRLSVKYVTLAPRLSAPECFGLALPGGERVDIAMRFGVRQCGFSFVRGVVLFCRTGRVHPRVCAGRACVRCLPVPGGADRRDAAEGDAAKVPGGADGSTFGAGQWGGGAPGPPGAQGAALGAERRESGVGQSVPCVPTDDAAQCDYYRALTRYVLNRACLSR